jgi:hypothetical protein
LDFKITLFLERPVAINKENPIAQRYCCLAGSDHSQVESRALSTHAVLHLGQSTVTVNHTANADAVTDLS